MNSNVFDDITDFVVCGLTKNTKIEISREQNILSSNKKNIRCHKTAKNSFLAELTCNVLRFLLSYSLRLERT